MIKLRVLRREYYFGLSVWDQCNHRVFIRGAKKENKVREEAMMTLHCWL